MKLFEFRLIETDVNRTFSNEHHEWKIVGADDKDDALKLISFFVKTYYPDPEPIPVVSGLPAYSFYKGTVHIYVDSFQEISLEKWLGKIFSLSLINEDQVIEKKASKVKIPPISVKDMEPEQKAKLLAAMMEGAFNSDITAEGIFHLVYFVLEGGKWV